MPPKAQKNALKTLNAFTKAGLNDVKTIEVLSKTNKNDTIKFDKRVQAFKKIETILIDLNHECPDNTQITVAPMNTDAGSIQFAVTDYSGNHKHAIYFEHIDSNALTIAYKNDAMKPITPNGPNMGTPAKDLYAVFSALKSLFQTEYVDNFLCYRSAERYTDISEAVFKSVEGMHFKKAPVYNVAGLKIQSQKRLSL